jgi:hypothetical protein
MMIIGVDYHPSFQQIAFLDQETGECGEHGLSHSDGEAEKFYRNLKQRGLSVRVGMEVTCPIFCTTTNERVYITARACELEFGATRGLQAAGAGGL